MTKWVHEYEHGDSGQFVLKRTPHAHGRARARERWMQSLRWGRKNTPSGPTKSGMVMLPLAQGHNMRAKHACQRVHVEHWWVVRACNNSNNENNKLMTMS
jgi:hypothetical protein